MAKRNRARERQNNLIRMLAGIGLILVGMALMLFLLNLRSEAASPARPDELSVMPASVSYPAPALSLDNVNGKTESLADYRQNVVLVNNWATWCPPCKAEMPTLESYYESHASEGFTIIAIEAGEAKKDVLPFVESYGLSFQIWLDPHNASLQAFRNQNLPNSFVIDRDGIVRYAWTGEISRAMLEKFVTPLLKKD